MHINVLMKLHGFSYTCTGPIPTAVYVQSCLVAGIVVPNPATNMDVRMLCFLCTVYVLLQKDIARVGQVIWPPGKENPRGNKINMLN
jgi:hypothetical protein